MKISSLIIVVFLQTLALYGGIRGQTQNLDNCEILSDMEFISGNILSENATDYIGCCHLCYLDSKCTVWSFDNSTKVCVTKLSETVVLKSIGKVSGRKKPLMEDTLAWQALVNTDFSDSSKVGWSSSLYKNADIPIEKCLTESLLGGIGKIAGSQDLTWRDIAPHVFTRIKIWFRFWFLTSWENEEAMLFLNGNKIWSQRNLWNSPGRVEICSYPFTKNYSSEHYTDYFEDVEVTVTLPEPTQTVTLKFNTTLDDNAEDESWAISYFKVAIVPDYSTLPSTINIESIFGNPITINLDVSHANDSTVKYIVTTLPSFGHLTDPGANNDLIRESPYTLTTQLYQRLNFYHGISSGDGIDEIPTEFSYIIFDPRKNSTIKEIIVQITIQIRLSVNGGCELITIGQVNNVNIDTKIQRFNFGKSYVNPVVFAMPVSYFDSSMAIARVTSVNQTGFSLFLQESTRQDGKHSVEELSYLALEVGSWQLSSGAHFIVGRTSLSALDSSRQTDVWYTVEFPSRTEFSEVPIVLAQVQSLNDAHWVKARIAHVTTSGFRVILEEEKESAHGGEILGWMAIENSTGLWGSVPYEAQLTPDNILTYTWTTINFHSEYKKPQFLADFQTHSFIASNHLRYRNLEKNTVALKWTADNLVPDSHTTETIGYIVLDGQSELQALHDRCSQKFQGDISTECTTGSSVLIILKPNSQSTTTILSIPSKGQLYQFKLKTNSSEIDYSEPISKPSTIVKDSLGRVVYTGYDMGSKYDEFTFQSTTSNGTNTNIAYVKITLVSPLPVTSGGNSPHPQPIASSTTSKSTGSPSKKSSEKSDDGPSAIEVTLVIVVVLMSIFLGLCGYLMWRRRRDDATTPSDDMISFLRGGTTKEAEEQLAEGEI